MRHSAAEQFVDVAVTQEWIRQHGSSTAEETGNISADSLGNIFITGTTRGDLPGPFAGDRDAYVLKYRADGSFAWARNSGRIVSTLVPVSPRMVWEMSICRGKWRRFAMVA